MISFANLTKKKISTAVFRKFYKKLFSAKGGQAKDDIELSVVFASPAKMKKLNVQYRNKHKVANVLSFLLEKGSHDARSGHRNGVGEIFLNAQEKDLPHLFVHGCLHLKGYDHEKDADAEKMEAMERKILK